MKYINSIAVTLLLFAGPAFAQFYEYTDKNGNKVITDSPPPGAEAQEKKMSDGHVYWSTHSEPDYPAVEKRDDPRGATRAKEQPKKNYSRLTVAMYMTDW